MGMSTRTCLDCRHWHFYGGSQGYSEMTPGMDMEIRCTRGHWGLLNLEGRSQQGFRETVARGADCNDFTALTEKDRAYDL